jgi:hypothetical protein
VLVDGEPILYLDRFSRRLRMFANATPELIDRALPGLRAIARGRPRGTLTLDKVGAESAINSSLTHKLREAGFKQDYRSMKLSL